MIRTTTLFLCILTSCFACVAPPGPTPRPLEGDPGPTRTSHVTLPRGDSPAWDGDPTSWEKLVAIEDWLSGAGSRSRPNWVPEAKLQLAEGRLVLARREVAELPPQVLGVRVRAAEAGFREVLAHRLSQPAQRSRAQRGLGEAGNLLAGTGSTSVATPGMSLQRRGAWSARPAQPRDMTPHQGPFSRITVHHSAKPIRELGRQTPAEVADALRRIQTVHMRDRGFGDIGYHFLIDPLGRVWEGRSLRFQGAHSGGAGGANNVGNVGICLLGDFDHERPTAASLRALETLMASLQKNHRIPRSRVYGHADWKATQCPGQHLTTWLERYSPKSARAARGTTYRAPSQKRAATPKVVQ